MVNHHHVFHHHHLGEYVFGSLFPTTERPSKSKYRIIFIILKVSIGRYFFRFKKFPSDIGGSDLEPGMMYFPIKCGAKEPQNPQKSQGRKWLELFWLIDSFDCFKNYLPSLITNRKTHRRNPGVIIHFGGIKQCTFMVLLRDFLYNSVLFGLVI